MRPAFAGFNRAARERVDAGFQFAEVFQPVENPAPQIRQGSRVRGRGPFLPQWIESHSGLRHQFAGAAGFPAVFRHVRSPAKGKLEPVLHFGPSHDAQGQRPGNKPAQGTALGESSIADTALKGRNNVCRPFRALSFFARIPRALPWAGLFAHLWCSFRSR